MTELKITFKRKLLPNFGMIAMVSVQDIGKAAARALLDGPRGLRVIELAGPVDVTPNEVARIFGTILGRPVQAVAAPLDAVIPTFTSFGVSEGMARLYREMYESVESGLLTNGDGEPVRGSTPIEETLRTLLG